MDVRTIFFSLAAAVLASGALANTAQIIPLDLTGSRPAVAISIGDGAPELWVFDTGAMGSVINMDRARALNLPHGEPVQLGSPAGGTPQEGFFTTLSNASINGIPLPPTRVVAAPSMLPDRVGVLSPNAFMGRLVTFDFGHAVVRISDKDTANMPSATPTPYIGNGEHKLPAINVSVGEHNWSAHIDTGSPGALTFPYAMASTLPLAAPPVRVGMARFVDGVHPRYRAQINGQVRVGPLTLTNPEIGFIDGLPFLNVGMGLLTQMTVTLDPEQQRSWASPAAPAPPAAN